MLSGAQHHFFRTSASRCPSVHCHASGQTQQPTNSGKLGQCLARVGRTLQESHCLLRQLAAGKPLTRIPSREARKPAQAPAPVPVQHSSTYLVRGEEPPVRSFCAVWQRLLCKDSVQALLR